MSRVARLVVSMVGTGLALIAGWGIMTVTGPDEKELLKELPEHNPKIMRAQQHRQGEITKALKKAAESEEPIWLAKPKK